MSNVRHALSRLSVRVSLIAAALAFCSALGTGLASSALSGSLSPSNAGEIVALAILCAGLGFGAGLALSLYLLRPLKRLHLAATRLATGDLITPIPVGGSRELRSLARVLENARHELDGITRWLTHEKAWAEYLVETISEGIVTLDAQGRITFMSASAAALIGCKGSDVSGKTLDELLAPAESDGKLSDLLPPPGQERTIPVLRRDSRTIALAVSGATLTPPVESAARTALFLRDVTSETAMQRLQGYFLANISHELQTPLASLRTSAELLVTDHADLDVSEQHKLHTSIYRGILRLESLIDNLLASASVQAGRFKVKPLPIDLGEPLEEALLFMEPLLNAAALTLDVDLAADLPLVCADSRRLSQVFVNLLSNAVKYAPPGSQIALVAKTDTVSGKEIVRVSVMDSGPGIPPEAREIIFSRFGRLDSPGARKDHGAGLGLYIARTIIESHGGSIAVEPRPGGGSCFTFTLPVAAQKVL
ncbi:MAG TPA: ATP-binding protein [Aggregatilineales bacterium]|nr:ATP-binding protein [Aggregatilineales bacterium]